MTDIYINPELSAELEKLGVERIVYSEVVISGRKLKEDVEIKRIEVPGSLTIFDLLYPDNARLIWPEGTTRVWTRATVEVLHMWQAGMDWRSYVAKAVERRKLNGKVVEELVK